jgi:hypothetical protein
MYRQTLALEWHDIELLRIVNDRQCALRCQSLDDRFLVPVACDASSKLAVFFLRNQRSSSGSEFRPMNRLM